MKLCVYLLVDGVALDALRVLSFDGVAHTAAIHSLSLYPSLMV